MSNDLTRNQLFFKGLLKDIISNPTKNNQYSIPFGLNLINYDLFDEDIQNMKFDLIENNLIKVSKFTLFKHWLIKKWYMIKFIFYMIHIKLKLK